MDTNNPYAAPTTNPAEDGANLLAKGSPRTIVWAWERLRLRYNLILAAAGVLTLLLFIAQLDMPLELAAVGSLFVAMGANACFLLGPLSETYVAAFFLIGPRCRPTASLPSG